MKMIIDEIGFFEWDGEESDKPAPGHLTIEDNGKITLEMHAMLGGDAVFPDIFSWTPVENKTIRGRLKHTGRTVLLTELKVRAGYLDQDIFYNFIAERCFVSDDPIDLDKLVGLSLPLKDLEEWYLAGDIKMSELSEDIWSLTVEKKQDILWPLTQGTLGLKNHITRLYPNNRNQNVNMTLGARFEYVHHEVTTAEGLLNWLKGFQEFISLVIDATYAFKWPEFLWAEGSETLHAQCYFSWPSLSEDNVTVGKYALPFEQVKDRFGGLLGTWLLKRAALGPGIHLYLGTVRNRHLYIEHQFVNMIWGLEALSRRNELSLPIEVPDKQAAKGLRILAEIENNVKFKSDDKRWLKNLLTRAAERSLEERLYEVISPVAIDIDPARLRDFCKECARLRNDLSHYGGERSPGDYDAFIQDIHPRMKTLRQLYRLIILNIIGVEDPLLRWSMYNSRHSLEFLHWLTVAGLISKETYKTLSGPKSPPPTEG
ncbi:hypothetical protein LLQ54_23785 [Rouxiella badensis]|uniref:HEPN domain-containing protein n=1 Tax=Rouxiella badensis TaxID=1646377 RepID=UPI001D14649D|nr:HEPN domain-containing protein [Rouxiella badensis]MCC3742879.1 hypothetical protein [Rouxiella badensis]